jgi:carboxylesterase
MANDGGEAFEFPGRSPGVLLVHGWTGSPWEVRPVAEALAGYGFACSAPLLPGHGLVPRALASVGWPEFTAAVDAALARVLAARGAAVVVGMSMGALLALDTAARHQERGVVGVAALGCALHVSPLAARVLRLSEVLGARMPDLYLSKPRGGDLRDPAARARNPGYLVNPLRGARAVLAGQRAARAALPSLRVPLLAVHGLLDTTAPLAGSLEMLRLAGTRDASLVVVPRSGHLVGVDLDRAEVARQVCAFVHRLAVAEPAGQ